MTDKEKEQLFELIRLAIESPATAIIKIEFKPNNCKDKPKPKADK